MIEQIEQLRGLSASNSDWQARAEEAERLVREQHMALAHEVAANGALQGQVAVLGIEADRAAEAFRRLDDLCTEQADTLARVREVAERQAQLDVSNGSWKAAARDVAGKVLRALEGGK